MRKAAALPDCFAAAGHSAGCTAGVYLFEDALDERHLADCADCRAADGSNGSGTVFLLCQALWRICLPLCAAPQNAQPPAAQLSLNHKDIPTVSCGDLLVFKICK